MRIFGYHHLSLSVTDLDKSTRWYESVLGLHVDADVRGEGFIRKRLRSAEGLTLTLTQHNEGSGDTFSERRTGMDHFALRVGETDMQAFKARFEELGVTHSEIQTTGLGAKMIALRDPDNIQLEVFAAPEEAG